MGQYGKTSQLQAQQASRLVNLTVKNDAGKQIGRCEDVVFDRQTGQIRYLALSFSNLGTGSKLFAVPFGSVAFSSETNQPRAQHLICNVDQSELNRHQGFGQDNWPRMAGERWPVRR